MAERDNAGQRILSARRTILGARDSLQNTIGQTLLDGAQCYVREAQAAYRWVQESVLAPDGVYVVKATGPGGGRWVRESGLMGFALLDDGVLSEGKFAAYKHQQLVQFAMDGDSIIYTGSIPRLALIFGTAHLRFDRGYAALSVCINESAESSMHLDAAGNVAISAAVTLSPGDHVDLVALPAAGVDMQGDGALRVVLA